MSSTTALASSNAMRIVVVVARLQGGQRRIVGARKPRQHRLLERGPGAGAIGDRGLPGRIASPCGVWTAMPAQQPQVQLLAPVQLIGASLSAHHVQGQAAVAGQARIVVQARHLERAHRDVALLQVSPGVLPCGSKTVAVTVWTPATVRAAA